MTTTTTYPVIKGILVSSKQYTWNTADSLGRGASAVVYLGRHQRSGQVVAVKVFHKHLVQSARQENLRELELLRNLKHQNIIRLLDIERESTSNQNVLIMEYCEGGSLHHMLDQPTYSYGLPEEEYILVLSHVSNGIGYLRRENIIHRDIKPGNIMRFITQFGMSIYKLTDFGAARNLQEEESFQSLYGTEEYLHPGVYEKAVLRLPTGQSFDARVDLWSLGVTFYHTATGQLPFMPYGGRSNRETMFQIISQKESGVISGVQHTEKGGIDWGRDLPDTCPLSRGLRSLVIPLIAGLMEPDTSKMISYESFFRIIERMVKKTKITFFHFSQCEDIVLYIDPFANLASLQDLIASHTDISAANQLLLLDGKSLEEIVDPLGEVNLYPSYVLDGPIFLFQNDISEEHFLKPPSIPSFPELDFGGMELDARKANQCCARAELIKCYTEKYTWQQKHLVKAILCFRMYIETRLQATKPSQDLMRQLMNEFQNHFESFFKLVAAIRDLLIAQTPTNASVQQLDDTLQENAIRPIYFKAKERMKDIEKYREVLVDKIEEVKKVSDRLYAVCQRDKCCDRTRHHLSVITTAYNRFRRDKNVKHQMTHHDEHIHHCERKKLELNCVAIRSITSEHCFVNLQQLFKDSLQIYDNLGRCLGRVVKVEANITSVLKCQKLLSEKMVKLRDSSLEQLLIVQESGYVSGSTSKALSSSARMEMLLNKNEPVSVTSHLDAPLYDEVASESVDFENGAKMLAEQTRSLEGKLKSLQKLLDENSEVMSSIDDTPSLNPMNHINDRSVLPSEIDEDELP